MSEKNEVIEVIRLLLKGYKTKLSENCEKVLKSTINNEDYYIWNCDYLLNQVIRHYNVPEERYFYSGNAIMLFSHLQVENNPNKGLKECYYREPLICISEVEGKLYKGASSNPYNKTREEKYVIEKDRKFAFKDAFHLEHIIPISQIISELEHLNPETCSDNEIAAILNKICVARITKEEDRKLHNKDSRDNNFDDVYKNLYNSNGNNIVLYRNSDDKKIEVK